MTRLAPLSCLALALWGAASAQTPPFDLLIVNGRVLDGTGNPWIRADIGVRGGRIAAMGSLGRQAATRTLDARDRYVTPGFIDVHSHAREGLEGQLNHAEPLLAQGITTAMLNPDGGGPVDIATVRRTLETRRTGVNTALFVPHGSIRQQVLGMQDRPPAAAELERMVDLVRAGMRAGGIGLSSGLYYAPGSYADTAEVIAMAKAAGEHGGVYSSHIRDEGDYTIGVVAAVDEVIRIAEEGRLPGVVSHMKALGVASWGLSMASLMRIEQARARGVEVWADQYPYEASGTSITGALVPRWAQVGGDDALRKRAVGAERGRLREDVRQNIARRGGAASLQIARFAPDPSIEGKTIADLAKSTGESPEEVALDLLARGGAGLVSFNMSERDIEQIMKQPYTMTSTDGDLVPMGEGKPHPRAYGAFPRKLRLYVRERGVIDWPFAIRSMTHLPATVFGVKDRGHLRTGAWADILLFDPARVVDRATYADPHHLSEGIDTVIVNGVIVRDEARFTRALPGVVVSPERR
jgi:N-acyl-D-aspartate/D-glutamate deacylase